MSYLSLWVRILWFRFVFLEDNHRLELQLFKDFCHSLKQHELNVNDSKRQRKHCVRTGYHQYMVFSGEANYVLKATEYFVRCSCLYSMTEQSRICKDTYFLKQQYYFNLSANGLHKVSHPIGIVGQSALSLLIKIITSINSNLYDRQDATSSAGRAAKHLPCI